MSGRRRPGRSGARFSCAGGLGRRGDRPLAPRRVTRILALLVAGAGAAAAVPLSTAAATTHGPTIGSARAATHRLAQQIVAEGLRTQSLVVRYDQAAALMAQIDSQLRAGRTQLASDVRAQSRARVRMRSLAVDAYVSAASADTASFTSGANATTLPSREVYLGIVSGSLTSAATGLKDAQHRTTVAEATLASLRSRTAATLRTLSSARAAAESATATDQALLRHANKSLLALVASANAKRARANEAAAEAALARAAQQATQHAAVTPPVAPVPSAATPGSYADPLRAISGLSAERIDMGVDYSGVGPIYAVGDGVVLSTYNGGWPGGTFIAYRLTDGPAAGLVMYAAEDITPTVQVGQSVSASTVIGQLYAGPDGIETGWAAAGDGETMAAAYGQFAGWNTTAFGINYSQMLTSLGAPGGIVQGGTAGTMPASWPQW